MAHNNSSSELSTLMNRAWAMHRETSATMSACMKQAWVLNDLADFLRGHNLHIKYLKKDGTIRVALATLNVRGGVEKAEAFRRTPSPKVFTYWDIERGDFRCFKCENFITAWM